MTNFDRMRERLLFAAGIHEPPKKKLTLAYLEQTQWSSIFEQRMRNRMMMGALRYGTLHEKRIKGNRFNVVEPIARKVAMYEETGNVEYLVDAANYCMLTAEIDEHPKKHWNPVDETTDHCKLK